MREAARSGRDADPMAALLEAYLNVSQFQRGDIVEGQIADVGPKAILVDIGGKSDATVLPREVEQMSKAEREALQPGQTVKVYVVEDGRDGDTVIVSLARAKQEEDWERAKKLLESQESVTLKVVDSNKGGLIVRFGQLRGFVPGSQIVHRQGIGSSSRDPERRWNALIGETMKLHVIEVTPERNRLILSERRGFHTRDLKRKVLSQLQVGAIEKGIVRNIVPFGAFVNIHGVDGLLHVSELAWRRITDPAEIVQVGQEIEVYILEVDLEHERLGLSLKRLSPDPWLSVSEKYHDGQIVEVKIVSVTTYGAFATLTEVPNIEGLIHISELSDQPVEHVRDVVRVGELRKARIISLRPAERRIAFSLKNVDAELSHEPEKAAA